MSAVNPASFSPNAINQPPSGIGPGAITAFDAFRPNEYDTSYSMAYGSDPDPYGAIPPYQINYNTYVPNYPAIPGVPSSFAPLSADTTPTASSQQPWPDNAGPAQRGQPILGTPEMSSPAGLQGRSPFFSSEAARSQFSPSGISPLMAFGPGMGNAFALNGMRISRRPRLSTNSAIAHRRPQDSIGSPVEKHPAGNGTDQQQHRPQFGGQQRSFNMPQSPGEFTPGRSAFYNQNQHGLPSMSSLSEVTTKLTPGQMHIHARFDSATCYHDGTT